MNAALRAALLTTAVASSAHAQPTFTLIPVIPEAISADGRVVVGAVGDYAASYNRDTDTVSTYVLPGHRTRATCVSGNGAVIAGINVFNGVGLARSWTWTHATGVVEMVIPMTAGIRVSCISRDGRCVGGITNAPGTGFYHSFVWTQEQGARMVPEGGNYASWMHALSPDGLKGVGSGSSGLGTRTAVWGSTYTWCSMIETPPGYRNTVAEGMSPDLRTIVGSAGVSGNEATAAFIWTAEDGTMVIPSPFPNLTNIELNSVDDARSIVGGIASASSSGAMGIGVIWCRGSGLMDANEYFAVRGVPTFGMPIGSINGISADGRVFTGRSTSLDGFIIDLGPCGTADFDHDGATGTDADIEAFFSCLAGNCCPTCDSADFNNDGDTGTDLDIEAFFRVLAGGNC